MRTLALSALVALAGCDSVSVPAPPEADDAPAWEAMLSAVNAVRARGATCGTERFPPAAALIWDGRLETAAKLHSRDMAENDYFGHTGSDGQSPGDRVRQAGYDWRSVGENIARNQTSVEQVVSDWVNSPSHCRQMLSASYLEIGAATVDGYWTQVFGRARS